MADLNPQTDIDVRYGAKEATPRSWADAELELAAAGIYWLSSVRPDGRPHVTPLIGVWQNGALHFCTGPQERKALNLLANDQVVLSTGQNSYDHGHDIVVEGRALRVLNSEQLQILADAYEAKYGEDWRFTVGEGGFNSGDHLAWVYRVEPVVAFGFGRGVLPSQTRWRFQ